LVIKRIEIGRLERWFTGQKWMSPQVVRRGMQCQLCGDSRAKEKAFEMRLECFLRLRTLRRLMI